jgi:hypothetical protein
MHRNLIYWELSLIMLLALYPIIELTRVIVVSGQFYFPQMEGQFWVEIAFMWTMYLSIIPVFLLINNYLRRSYRRKREILRKIDLKKNRDS